MESPVIAITMGDAAGIGPELIAKMLAEEPIYQRCRPFIIGDPSVMRQIATTIGSGLDFSEIDDVADAKFAPGVVEVLRPDGMNLNKVYFGTLAPEMGHAAAKCMKTAMVLGQSDAIHGSVFAPMNKEAFHLAGYDYMDEMAYLAELTDSHSTYIVGLVGSIWTATVSEHVSLAEAVSLIKRDNVLSAIRRVEALLEDVGRSEGTIAVAALNPHGGEGGLFGSDEIDEIEPAVKLAQQDDIDARGPYPADTIFITARNEGYDAILCMYHDQANIARKLMATWDGATVYMGLPIPCGSTAHGTAFDKAGQGICDPGSLRTALDCVISLASE